MINYALIELELELVMEEVAKLPRATDTCGTIPSVLDLVDQRLWEEFEL